MTGRYDLLAGVEGLDLEGPRARESSPGDERALLEVGDLAQLLLDDRERLWVEICRVQRCGGSVTYHGRLQSVPLAVKVGMTSVIRFEPRNVLRIERSAARLARSG